MLQHGHSRHTGSGYILLTGNLCRGVGRSAPAAAAQISCQSGGRAHPGGCLRRQLEDPFCGNLCGGAGSRGQGRRSGADRLFLRDSLLCFRFPLLGLQRWAATVDHTLMHCRKVVLVAWESLVRGGTEKCLTKKLLRKVGLCHLGSHQRQRVCRTLCGGQNRIAGAWPDTDSEL